MKKNRFRTVVHSNGSKWAGEEPDALEVLEERLRTETLDPSFQDREYGNFVYPHGELEMTRFWGNFATYSHVFCIDTDDPEIIARLTKLIRANQKTAAYRKLRREHVARKRAAKAERAERSKAVRARWAEHERNGT